VSVIPSNCLEDNSSGSTEYLVQADANSTVTIKIDRPVFEVEWLNIGGETIQTDTLRYGAMPSAPADGLCVSAGYVPVWDRDFSVVVADTSYQVEEEKPSTDTPYQVNHLCQNIEDDEYVLQETETMRGTTGEKTAAVAKSYDGMTAQTFTQVEIKGDGKTEINIYYNRNLYTVSWDIDGTVTTEEYKYGATPVYKGETPEKPSDVQYNYTFESWGEITPVTDHVTYNAVFTSALNKYGITWDIDGKTWTEYYDYGETPSYKGKTPERDADVQYTYTFKDWGEITPVTGDKTYTAIFDEILNKYTITWKVEDEEIEEIYEYGATPVYKGVNPVKLADVANTYAFNGWGQMEPVSGDKTYTAEFVSTLNKYTITWVVDGVQTTELYKYGTTPVYKGVTPTKAATPQYTYTFADWGEVTEVTGDKTYTANFEKSLNEYTITWNIDGMQTTEVYTYGDTPSYKGDTPVRAANAQYTYTFRDWGNLSKVTEDKTYTAVFDNKVNKYSITWIVDGKHFTEVYEYDELPTYKGPEPTKDVDAANTYAFNGWGQIEPVSGDKAYTAVFVSTANKYTVIWDVDGVKQSELYTYGDMPSYKWTEPTKASDGKYIYTFAGWGELEEVTGDKTYVASFDTAPVEYTITWDADGVKTTETYKYGDTPAFKGKTPARTADDQYTYKFAGWGDITNVECDKTYVAIFDATLNQYTITWDVDGDKVTELYNYGEMPTYKGVTPTRAADEVATYAFNGWGTIHKVTADCVYTATFIETSVREDLTNRATCTLSYRKIAYNGWKQTPEVTVTDPQNNILEAGKDYIVTYEDGCTEVGRYKITIDFIGAYRGTAAAYYTIVPKAPKKATAKDNTTEKSIAFFFFF